MTKKMEALDIKCQDIILKTRLLQKLPPKYANFVDRLTIDISEVSLKTLMLRLRSMAQAYDQWDKPVLSKSNGFSLYGNGNQGRGRGGRGGRGNGSRYPPGLCFRCWDENANHL